MDNLENTLNLVGLRGYDAKVYSIMLDFRDMRQEPVTAYSIAKHCTPQMHVTTVYDSLGRLTDQGYVSFVVEGRGKKYQLNGGVRQLITQLEERKRSINDLLPRLKKHPRSEINRAKISHRITRPGIGE
ncbi:MAG: hypothetical protein IH951_14540 [Bacteroidetes bacterium]|nr:hypothetical protein [Bacteroidota bacterium]